MVFALLYACLRLLLDLAEVRLGGDELEGEVLLLRHELRVLRRAVKRPQLTAADRVVVAAFCGRLDRRKLAGLVQPETIVGWHRELVRRKWASFGTRRRVGRPRLDAEVGELILRMARKIRAGAAFGSAARFSRSAIEYRQPRLGSCSGENAWGLRHRGRA